MTEDALFVSERARVVHCLACGTTHALHIPPGYGAWCGRCHARWGECQCGTGVAGDTRAKTHPPVSLLTQAEQDTSPLEETQRSEWDICPVCKLATLYCRGH